jgi:hypothetical protein
MNPRLSPPNTKCAGLPCFFELLFVPAAMLALATGGPLLAYFCTHSCQQRVYAQLQLLLGQVTVITRRRAWQLHVCSSSA